MDITQRIKDNFLESIRIKTESLDELAPLIASAANAMADSLLNNHKIMACGNGGSAADAQHFSAEMLNRFETTIANFANVDVITVLPIGHYSTALSELVYEVPSIVLYVNVDSIELYPSVSEGITDIIAYYEDRKTS